MITKNITTEGRKLYVSDTNMINTHYVVYQDKIWYIFSKEGMGKEKTFGLIREKAQEKIFAKGQELKKIMYILKPSGHITV